jgi:Fe-S cluster assembly iron-binding protein IscA
MLQVTDRAMDVLREMREISGAAEGEGIVLYREDDGGVGFGVGSAAEADEVIAREGQAVVIVAEDLSPSLDGLVLDFVAGEDVGEFTLVRP